ncbi:MAG: hypothetical protein IKU72_03795 [Oscillospiraceae bacterium]|nr:hypothetical protein [Oscillospiraceae bacterium]
MTNRENFIRAIRRDNPEYVPLDFRLCPSQNDRFKEKTGSEDFMEYYNLPIRYVELNPTNKNYDFIPYYKGTLPADYAPLSWAKEWGIMGIAGMAHFQHMFHPLAQVDDIEELKEFPMPDLDEDYRYEGVAERIQQLKDQDIITVKHMKETIFEMAWYLRGMDNLMIDFFDDEDYANCLLDRLTQLRINSIRKITACGIDVIQLGDDIATQLDMLMSPDQWREWLKPRMKAIIDAAKEVNPDVIIFYHSCGNIQRVIPDLIEIGIDVLNPIQPECMDVAEIKAKYGDQISFWGGLGTQTVMPFGTPEEVEAECKRLIEVVGKGGGFVLSPSHVVEPEVTWENLQAMIFAHKKYSKY